MKTLALALLVSFGSCQIPPVQPPSPPTPTPTPANCPQLIEDARKACKDGEPWTEECKVAQGAYLGSDCAVTIPDPQCVEGQTYGCWQQRPGELPTYVCPVYNSEGGIIDVAAVFDPKNCPKKPDPVEPDPPAPPNPDPNVPSMPADTSLQMNSKWWGGGNRHDSTVKIVGLGAKQYCKDMGWTDGRQSCALAVDDDPRRLPRELAWLGALIGKPHACPVWQYTAGKNVIIPCFDNKHSGPASCDHFGSVTGEDDDKTPEFEGKPKECGDQRNEFGPFAGFSTRPHSGGIGFARACLPNYTGCGPWVKVKL
jgi:hypothetical protein